MELSRPTGRLGIFSLSLRSGERAGERGFLCRFDRTSSPRPSPPLCGREGEISLGLDTRCLNSMAVGRVSGRSHPSHKPRKAIYSNQSRKYEIVEFANHHTLAAFICGRSLEPNRSWVPCSGCRKWIGRRPRSWSSSSCPQPTLDSRPISERLISLLP